MTPRIAIFRSSAVSALLLATSVVAQPPIRYLQFGDPERDDALGIAVDGDYYYVSGGTYGSYPGQTQIGYGDALLTKFSKNGKMIWTRQFGTTRRDYAAGVAVTADAVYVVGASDDGGVNSQNPPVTDGDPFIRKFDKNGNLLWVIQEVDPSVKAYKGHFSVSALEGALYLCGVANGEWPGQKAAGDGDVYVQKRDLNGTILWTRQFGSFGRDQARAMAVTANGIYVGGGRS